jgi:hypothetical protein
MADRIATIDMGIVKRRGQDWELYQMLDERGLGRFELAYKALGDLLARVRRSAGTAPVVYRTPPGQTTVPQNADYTGGSSSSAESKPEPHVNQFAGNFLGTAFLTVSKWIQPLRWTNPEARAHLEPQYVPSFPSDLVPTNLCHPCASALHNP